MNITLFDRLRPYLSKLIAAAVIPALAWLAARTGYADFADAHFAEIVSGAILWLFLTLTHTQVSKRTNPGNVASAHLAKAQATDTAALKGELPVYVATPMDDAP